MPAPPLLRSGDGRFHVAATAAAAAFRAPVLGFAQSFRRQLAEDRQVPLLDPRLPYVLDLGVGPTGSTRVAHMLWREYGGVGGRVEVADPACADLDELRFALAAVFLRTTIHRLAPAGRTPTEPPPWFVRGLARGAVRTNRLADVEAVCDRWSHGQLPPAWELCTADAAAPGADPAVAALWVAWCEERPEPRQRWGRLFSALAAGRPWDAAMQAEVWLGTNDVTRLDESWDLWLAARGLRVLEPGVTTAALVGRLRLLLPLYPGEGGMPIAPAWLGGIRPERLPELAPAAWLPGAARAKAFQCRAFAAGRDRRMQELCEAFAAPLDAFASDGDPAALRAALAAARTRSLEVESLASVAPLRTTNAPALPARRALPTERSRKSQP